MKIETWVCSACGPLPCKVIIEYDNSGKYKYDFSRFQRRSCICDNSPSPDWVQQDNVIVD